MSYVRGKLREVRSNMIARCYNPRSASFPYYWTRGIEVTPRWLDSFEVFLKDVAPSFLEVLESGRRLTFGRIKNNGDYKLSNCAWEDSVAQANNRRPFVLGRNGRWLGMLTRGGKTKVRAVLEASSPEELREMAADIAKMPLRKLREEIE